MDDFQGLLLLVSGSVMIMTNMVGLSQLQTGLYYKVGPLLVISGVITPISGVITPVSHL